MLGSEYPIPMGIGEPNCCPGNGEENIIPPGGGDIIPGGGDIIPGGGDIIGGDIIDGPGDMPGDTMDGGGDIICGGGDMTSGCGNSHWVRWVGIWM
jgi:hypothetical protein